jgi:transcription antitermination factor NusA-like protein
VVKSELSNAIGTGGVNVSLASRLLGVRIRIVAEEPPTDG